MTPLDISLWFVWLVRTSLHLFVRIGYASLLYRCILMSSSSYPKGKHIGCHRCPYFQVSEFFWPHCVTPFDISLCFVWLMRTSLRLFVRIGYASLLSFFDFLKIIIIRFYSRPVANVAFSTVTAQTLLAKKYFVVNAPQCGKNLSKKTILHPFPFIDVWTLLNCNP